MDDASTTRAPPAALFEPIEPPWPAAPTFGDLFAGGDRRRLWWRHHVADRRAGWLEVAQHHVLRPLPVEWCSALGGWYARVLPGAVAPGREARRLLRENLERYAPAGSDRAAIDALERRWWDNTGRMKAEYSVMPKIFRGGRVRIEGAGHLAAAKATARPVVFVSSHIGNWEVLLTALCGREDLAVDCGAPVAAPHSVARNRYRRNLATLIRTRHGRLAFPPGPESARRFHRILARRAGHVVFLVDALKDGEIASPRFGRPHPASSNLMTAVRLAARTDALLVPVHALRTRGAHFRLVFGAPIDPRDHGADVGDTTVLADRVSDATEAVIVANLDQWSNLRRLRPGAPDAASIPAPSGAATAAYHPHAIEASTDA